MKEHFVTYEQALALKELGFDEPCLGGWILHEIEFESRHFKDFVPSGFPDEQHTILDLKHSDYKPYQIRTDQGYGPIEKYYKIIKKEEKIVEYREIGDLKMATKNEWVEIPIK
jgi:hypothetical protein